MLTTLLYSQELWTIYRRHLRGFERFYQKSQKIFYIKLQLMTSDADVFQKAGCPSVENMLIDY